MIRCSSIFYFREKYVLSEINLRYIGNILRTVPKLNIHFKTKCKLGRKSLEAKKIAECHLVQLSAKK